jgi:hypothetical protein
MGDLIDNSTFQELAEFDLIGGGRRLIFEGEERFEETQPGVARIVMLGDANSEPLTAGLLSDSDVDVAIPSADIDAEKMFEVSMVFFVGERPVVLLKAEEPLPRAIALFACQGVLTALEGTELTEPGYRELARVARNSGRWMLEMRMRRIEQTVRDALNDEVMSAEDYEALRRYADRLALVERLARELSDRSAGWTSHEPPARFPSISGSLAPDRYYERLGEVEAEARASVARLSGLISSQQIVLTQRQGEKTERFQRLVTLVGAAVLVPGLVAGSFGANVDFPGRESAAGFWAMLALMVAGGIGSYGLLRALESGQWRNLCKGKLAILAGVAGILATVGVGLMIVGDGEGKAASETSPKPVAVKQGAGAPGAESANCGTPPRAAAPGC